jgi:NAD(P)-dependent dehydrogenase (short-subunit alcohol dehydrogenase family)
MANRLANKIAIITGAARGIGASTAQCFIQEGASVVLVDIDTDAGTRMADALGERAYFVEANVVHESAWATIFEQTQQHFGPPTILFNNAGLLGTHDELGLAQTPEHITLEAWHKIQTINVDSIVLGCRYAIEFMKKHGGSIINMSSRSGLVGVPSACAYAASKAAIFNYTKSVALYCAEHDYPIRCNSVHPAAIDTNMWDHLGTDEASRASAKAKMAQTIPLHRMGTSEDVAWAVVYLASDESSYITGTDLKIDGGILAGSAASAGQKD